MYNLIVAGPNSQQLSIEEEGKRGVKVDGEDDDS